MTNKKDVPETARDVPTVEVTVEYLDALRKAVGLQIDPATAEVEWTYAYTVDPYGDDPDLPEEYRCVGREYFARSPGSNVWVSFHDLPEASRDALWDRHKSKLAFPAGLIPAPFDQNPCAHWRRPMDMILQGWSTSLFHASQQWSTRSS